MARFAPAAPSPPGSRNWGTFSAAGNRVRRGRERDNPGWYLRCFVRGIAGVETVMRRSPVRAQMIPTLVSLVATLAFALWIPGQACLAQDGKNAATPKITVSSATTVYSEPLDEQGYVDYAEILNRLSRQDIRSHDNVYAGLYPVTRPFIDYPEIERAFCTTLGIDSALDPKSRLTRAPKIPELETSRYDSPNARPWCQGEFPKLYRWVVENKPAADLLIRSSRRKGCFVPVSPFRESTVPELFGFGKRPPYTMDGMADAISFLALSANMKWGEGELDDGWRRIVTIHHLGQKLRLQGLECSACCAHYGLIATQPLSRKWALERSKALHDLIEERRARRSDDGLEQVRFLQHTVELARGQKNICDLFGVQQVLRKALGGDASTVEQHAAHCVALADWDAVLRIGNQWFNLLAESEDASFTARGTAIKRIHSRVEKWKTTVFYSVDFDDLSVKAATSVVAAVLVDYHIECLTAHHEIAAFTLCNVEMARVAYAIAAWRADHGDKIPANLGELVPDYLKKLPQDPASDCPFGYRRVENGYILSSPGLDRKYNDAGTGFAYRFGYFDGDQDFHFVGPPQNYDVGMLMQFESVERTGNQFTAFGIRYRRSAPAGMQKEETRDRITRGNCFASPEKR